MPGGDGTGPSGAGPLTGGRWGPCAGPVGTARPDLAYGRGGWGRGWRHWYNATGLPRWARGMNTPVLPVAAPTRQQEMEALKDQAQRLTGQLQELNKRIEELGEEPVS